ncbi:MAG: hypothetical protein ACFCGT_10670 [Sandaracinaceae bacterium]
MNARLHRIFCEIKRGISSVVHEVLRENTMTAKQVPADQFPLFQAPPPNCPSWIFVGIGPIPRGQDPSVSVLRPIYAGEVLFGPADQFQRAWLEPFAASGQAVGDPVEIQHLVPGNPPPPWPWPQDPNEITVIWDASELPGDPDYVAHLVVTAEITRKTSKGKVTRYRSWTLTRIA